MALIPSKNRDNSVNDNLSRFEEMLKGTDEGKKWFMRAKIDYQSPNGAMRDPAVFRCVDKAHHVTGFVEHAIRLHGTEHIPDESYNTVTNTKPTRCTTSLVLSSTR